MKLVYLIGQPGAGKTTLARAIEAPFRPMDISKPFAHRAYYTPPTGEVRFVSLGKEREGFAGTDTLGMGVQPKAVEFLSTEPYPLVFGEGDRLGGRKFFAAMLNAGVDLRVVVLGTPDDEAANRRAARGSEQNETWLKGRISKVAGLTDEADVWLDGMKPPGEVLADFLAAFPEFKP